MHVRDEKTQNTSGGTFTSGAWRTRTLNIVKTNEISGASLGSNQVTLPAGTYYIDAGAIAKECVSSQLRLMNITDNIQTLVGLTNDHVSGSASQWLDTLTGRFVVTGTKVFELQHQCSSTRGTDGFGLAANFTTEVYADVRIWKVL